METGPAKGRRRVSATTRSVSGVLRCEQSQLARFDRFWNEDTAGGVLPFIFPGQVYEGAFLLTESGEQLLTEADEPLLVAESWLVTFAHEDKPPARPHARSVVWAVNLSFNIMP
jgi:hypothetical protein